MFKIGIAAAILAAAGTTAVVVQKTRADEPKPVASAAPVASAVEKPAAPPSAAISAPKLPGSGAPAIQGGLPPGVTLDEEEKVHAKETLTKLALDKGPSRGPTDAPVTIIVFQDLMCKYCGTVLGTIDEVWDEFPGKLRLVVKQFPVHKEARLAAEASLAAEAQGKFWELHDTMMANQEDLSRDAILGYAKTAGLDVKKLAKDLDDHKYEKAVADEMKAAVEIGMHAVPTFLINGVEMRGARPPEAFRQLINDALANVK